MYHIIWVNQIHHQKKIVLYLCLNLPGSSSLRVNDLLQLAGIG